ncbi:MAG: hypothetical protein JSV33_12415 [bacterium]|nr:MAG: hypothetical protein JSV33_12415 [bacterium]
MKRIRIAVNSFFLACSVIFSIIIGFGAYKLSEHANQLAVQVPVAGAVCIISFLVWTLVVTRSMWGGLSLRETHEYLWVFGAALLWSPVIFVPLHLITQGYLTSFGNILAMWLFQIPASAVTLFVSWRWFHPHSMSSSIV